MGYAALQAARRDELRLLRREQIRQLRSQRGIVTGIALEGWCEPRRTPLEHTDLWIAGEGPPEQLPVEEHHKCGICYNVKSHPVSYVTSSCLRHAFEPRVDDQDRYLCGHSHCYVCICMWLEHQWTCPECVTPMYRAPFRHWAEEAGIERAYPNWNDGSTVNYSWKGLLFPQAPKVLVPATP
jgi:hypothetical protein